ncbi:MAG: acylphosphatase [Thermomicrobiaceae bacterium]
MPGDSAVTTVRALVTGHVQGVGFRQFVRSRARDFGLAGWVRNREDGRSVEIEAAGKPERVQEFLKRVEAGPPGSHVEQVDVDWNVRTSLPEKFEIRR